MPTRTVSDNEGRSLLVRWAISDGFLLLEEQRVSGGGVREEQRTAIPIEALRAVMAYQNAVD